MLFMNFEGARRIEKHKKPNKFDIKLFMPNQMYLGVKRWTEH